MKGKIKRKVEELWQKIEHEIRTFEEVYDRLKESLEERELGTASIEACFAVMHLRNVEETLDDIELLERLLVEEHEEKN